MAQRHGGLPCAACRAAEHLVWRPERGGEPGHVVGLSGIQGFVGRKPPTGAKPTTGVTTADNSTVTRRQVSFTVATGTPTAGMTYPILNTGSDIIAGNLMALTTRHGVFAPVHLGRAMTLAHTLDKGDVAAYRLLMGGGITRGQIYGASDSTASEPAQDAVTVENYLATVYHQLGINSEDRLMAPGNRPIDIVREGKVRRELIA